MDLGNAAALTVDILRAHADVRDALIVKVNPGKEACVEYITSDGTKIFLKIYATQLPL